MAVPIYFIYFKGLLLEFLTKYHICGIIQIVFNTCVAVISTGGPLRGPKWRNLALIYFSTRLWPARKDK